MLTTAEAGRTGLLTETGLVMTEVRTTAGAVTGAGMVATGMSGLLSNRGTSEDMAAAGTLKRTGGIEGMLWVEAGTGSRVMGVSEG